MRRVSKLLFLLMITSFTMVLRAEIVIPPVSTDNYLKAGILEYQKSNFREALDYFLLAENTGLSSPTLYYNLGNAYHQQGKIALAIVYYKRALLLDSAFSPARRNLDFMLSITTDKQIDLEENAMSRFLTSLYYFFSINTLLCICLSVLALIILFIHLQWLSPEKDNTVFRFLNFLFLFILLGLTIMTYSRIYLVKNNNEAVITESTVYVFSGPADSFTRLFTIHEGTVLKIQKEELNWTQVSTISGYSGWIDSNTYLRIKNKH